MPIAPKKITPANFAKLRFQRVSRTPNERREMFRVASLLKRRDSETRNPWSHGSRPTQRDIEHTAKGNQLTPKAQEQLRRRQRLQLLRRDMSNVAERRARRRRIRSVYQEHFSPSFRQRPGDRAPYDAGANDGDFVPANVRFPHARLVTCRSVSVTYTIYAIPSTEPLLMATPIACNWLGIFPAATTQFDESLNVDLAATQAVQAGLINDGVHGIVVLGTVGENNSLSADEKRRVLKAAVEASGGKVPIIAGVSEFTTPSAVAYARDAERIGANGLMVLPAMVYVPTAAELEYHFRAVAQATSLPIMLYNNPPGYRVNIDLATLQVLAEQPNIVALKESAPDTRRFTDIFNAFGDRFVLFAGLDDVAFEGICLGAKGWVSGLTNAFPKESLMLHEALVSGNLEKARKIYQWFMPLLHLDAQNDLVQSIKLAEQIMGRGSERVRPPRLPLSGARRAEVTAMVNKAAAARPV
jgi:4-hydroxy-tetrahydrodipicolinate synthase